MSDFEEVISTDLSIPQRAPPPPANFRVVLCSDWSQAKAVLYEGAPLDVWTSWWLTTPWHLHHPTRNIQWTQTKKTANVWQYYQACARSTDGKPFIRCIRCTQTLIHPGIANTGTTTLIRHLETKSCRKQAKLNGNRTIEVFLDQNDTVKKRKYIESVGPWSVEAFFEQTLQLIGSLNLSFRVLDSTELHRWVELIRKAPKNIDIHLIPSRKVRTYLRDHVQDGRARILQTIPAEARIAIALDCWTSPNHKSFLAVTGYFIDHSWDYQEVLLGFEHIEGQHDGQKLAQCVQKILEECNIELSRVITLTTDNASNNKTLNTALEQVLSIIRQDEIHDGITRLPCLAHVIQLACKELLVGIKIQAKNDKIITSWYEDEEQREQHTEVVHGDGAPSTLKKIRDAVIYINASTQRRDKFHQVQHHRPLNLVQDVATRWNSTLKMMLRARKLREALERYTIEYPNDSLPIITSEEWRHVDYLIEILYPFHVWTNAVGKIKKGPSIHNVYAIYDKLFDHIEDYSTKLERKRLPWKKQIHASLMKADAKLKKYYSETQSRLGEIYAIGTILGPRWKLSIFEGESWSDDNYADQYLQVLRKVYTEYKARQFPDDTYSRDILSSSPAPDTSSQIGTACEDQLQSSRRTTTPLPQRKLKRKNTDNLNSLLGDVKKAKRYHTAHEIDRYLDDNDNLGIDFEDDNPNHTLRFWKRAASRNYYPVLAAIARDYLAIPAAGVGVERLFNTARDICSYRRHRLQPSTIRQLMMTTCLTRFDRRTREKEALLTEEDDEDCNNDSDNYGDEDESDDEFEEELDAVQGLISEDEDDDEQIEQSVEDREPSLPPLPEESPTSLRPQRRRGLLSRSAASGSSRLQYVMQKKAEYRRN